MTKHKTTHFNMDNTELQKVQQNEELVPDVQNTIFISSTLWEKLN